MDTDEKSKANARAVLRSFFQNLVDKDQDTMSQEDFASLPIDERRRILAQQAKQMESHYEQTKIERTEWQAGDFD